LLELLSLGFFVGAPILVISAIGQWVIQFRLIPVHNVPHMAGLRCIVYAQVSAYMLSLIIWILWPLDPLLIMYNNRISVPTVIGEFIAIPLWINSYGYFDSFAKDKKD
ncbi:MAG: hypothetical protein QM504_01400, partial [Pseudomonadota bacterium]